jgi:hypothetical protein
MLDLVIQWAAPSRGGMSITRRLAAEAFAGPMTPETARCLPPGASASRLVLESNLSRQLQWGLPRRP